MQNPAYAIKAAPAPTPAFVAAAMIGHNHPPKTPRIINAGGDGFPYQNKGNWLADISRPHP